MTGIGRLERRVLGAIGQDSRTPDELAGRLGASASDVHHALLRLVEAGLVDADDGRVRSTETGRRLLATPAEPATAVPSAVTDAVEEAVDAARSVGASWAARTARVSAERKAAADALLASDADRDRAVRQLTDAFSQGRLTSAELDERTGGALAARTRGDLDRALDGLGGLAHPVERHPARGMVFWLATVLFSPFLLIGALLLLLGHGVGSHVFALVLLAVTGTPLYCVWRWWRPRPSA